jgi:hypothetical protein
MQEYDEIRDEIARLKEEVGSNHEENKEKR